MSTRPLELALVGAGGIAQAYVQLFEDLVDARVVAVADVRHDAAVSAAESLGARAYPSYAALVGAESLDGVVVCTPPVTHHEICGFFLDRGLPVLCEKPLTTDLASARDLVARAERSETLLTMASKFRYVEDLVTAKSIVGSGLLGEVILFENVFASRVPMAGRWNANPAVSGGGVLIDNGTHSVDIARYLLGPISEVMAVEGKRVQGLPVEDTAQLFLRSAEGVMGTVDLSWSIDKALDSYVNVYGSHGTIQVGWRQSRYRQASSPDWVVFGSGYDKLGSMRRQVEDFCRGVRGAGPILIGTDDALASVAVIETAYASMGTEHWALVDGGLESASPGSPR
ncbi:MAG: Gfo/Idh/MocA family oxidoreductase [Acidimicrobiia bacterium]|nr:Gfo/Idh/MocA family oxidoreductase [Acidimicrobiia bacterium]